MKCLRVFIAKFLVEDETRPVYRLDFENGDFHFVFEREVACDCEDGVVHFTEAHAESWRIEPSCYTAPCDRCDAGIRTVDIDCDSIGNTQDSDLYLPHVGTHVVDIERVLLFHNVRTVRS